LHFGAELPVWSVVPFVGLLLAIAILPLAAPHYWEHNRNKGVVAALFSAPVVVYLLLGFGEHGLHELLEKAKEYTAFILLLASLYVITGGIHVRGSLSGTPLLNTVLLAIGTMLASLIGTTGASVLLIRPLLAANAPRQRVTHIVVFFIFSVSNCGGLLTPLGDPPLFLGFLKGVPFEWTFALWPEWLMVNGSLIAIFHVWDQIVFAREERERPGSQLEEVQEHAPLGIDGLRNFGFLLGIVAVIYASGRGFGTGGAAWPFGVQEGLMAVLAAAAYATTDGAIRERNRFGFAPIIEVALLFAGIFVTMAPALLLLNAHAGSLGLRTPAQFFWSTGLLSSFLDNAPTYLTFAATAAGLADVGLEGRYLAEFLARGADNHLLLAAISCGAVFMGANTYIGNGPNFMVKAIAEERGVRMPSFFAYMLYSGGVLIPLFVLATLVFFY
jgi:Na+/H+ antiporter NhaD/arsenite permease-like protein